MKITFSWGQVAEVEALIDGFRAAQTYGSGEICRDSGARITWNDDQVVLDIPEEPVKKGEKIDDRKTN
jgi:hypothetical protein